VGSGKHRHDTAVEAFVIGAMAKELFLSAFVLSF